MFNIYNIYLFSSAAVTLNHFNEDSLHVLVLKSLNLHLLLLSQGAVQLKIVVNKRLLALKLAHS